MSPSNEEELADMRRTLAMLAERVVRLERKVMGRPLMEVFAEDGEEHPCELCNLTKDWDRQWMGVYAKEPCSGLLDSCPCFECRTWREDHG